MLEAIFKGKGNSPPNLIRKEGFDDSASLNYYLLGIEIFREGFPHKCHISLCFSYKIADFLTLAIMSSSQAIHHKKHQLLFSQPSNT